MGRKPKKRVPPLAVLECVRCGQNKPETEFLFNRWSKIYERKRVPLCMDCVQSLFKEYTYQFGEKTALFLVCAAVDIPFVSARYDKIVEVSPPFTFGKYIKQLQLNQFRNCSFACSVADGDFPTADHSVGKHYATADRVDAIRAEVTALREELRDLREQLCVLKNKEE